MEHIAIVHEDWGTKEFRIRKSNFLKDWWKIVDKAEKVILENAPDARRIAPYYDPLFAEGRKIMFERYDIWGKLYIEEFQVIIGK